MNHLECGGKRYSERRRFCEVKKSGAAPASAGLSPHSRNNSFLCFLWILWFRTFEVIGKVEKETSKSSSGNVIAIGNAELAVVLVASPSPAEKQRVLFLGTFLRDDQ